MSENNEKELKSHKIEVNKLRRFVDKGGIFFKKIRIPFIIFIIVVFLAVIGYGGFWLYGKYEEKLENIKILNQEIVIANQEIDRLSNRIISLNSVIEENEIFINKQSQEISKLKTDISQKTNEINSKEEEIKQQQAEKDRVDRENKQAMIDLLISSVRTCVFGNLDNNDSYYSCTAEGDSISCSSTGYYTKTHTCFYSNIKFTCKTKDYSVYDCQIK